MILHGANKEDLEQIKGELTLDQYREMVKSSIPDDAIDVNEIDLSQIPKCRSNRDNWKWDNENKSIIF